MRRRRSQRRGGTQLMVRRMAITLRRAARRKFHQFLSGFSPSTLSVNGKKRTAPAKIGKRYFGGKSPSSRVSWFGRTRTARTQLMTHKIQMMASNCVGQIAVQPLKAKANH